MKKNLVISILSFSLGLVLTSFTAYANQSSINNYYPSPSGNYTKIHLVNSTGNLSGTTTCSGSHPGTIFADSTTGFLEICKADGTYASYPGNHFNRFLPGPCPPSLSLNQCPTNYLPVSCQPFYIGTGAGTEAHTWSCGFVGQDGTSTAKSGCFSIYGTNGTQPAFCNPASGVTTAGDANAYDVGCDAINSSDMTSGPVFKRNCCFNNDNSSLSKSYFSTCAACTGPFPSNATACSSPPPSTSIPYSFAGYGGCTGTSCTYTCNAPDVYNNAGACLPGCNISGIFYTPGQKDPSNPCLSCQTATSTSAWTDVTTGTSCDGTDVCYDGNCDFCIPGSSAPCGSGVCTGTMICNASGSAYGSCSTLGNTCVAPTSCTNASTCTSTGTCPAPTDLPIGTSCGSGDVCYDGSCDFCVPGSLASCGSGACAGNETCNGSGSGYGSCSSSGATCVAPTSCASSSTCTSTGTCPAVTDDPNYTLCPGGVCLSGVCTPTSCTPNAVTSCGSGICSGTETCNSTGSAESSCTSAGTSCAAATPCTNPSSCNSSGNCPAVTNVPDGTLCSGGTCESGVCVVPGTCSGGVFCDGTPSTAPYGTVGCQNDGASGDWEFQCDAGGVWGVPTAGPTTCTCPCTPNCEGHTCGMDPACGTLSCGTCSGSQTCGGGGTPGQCGGGSCTPNCEGHTCGMDPACGTLSCGTCSGSQTCGGGGTPGQCGSGCTPTCSGHCAQSDGCGGTCPGTCTLSNYACTEEGSPGADDYTCVCQPDCSPNGPAGVYIPPAVYCGAGDGCGGTCVTGPCPIADGTNSVCQSGECVCNPINCSALIDGCGQPNGCNGTCSGGCAILGQTCTYEGPDSYECTSSSCTPKTCLELGDNCGNPPDGCGGTLSCGACGSYSTSTSCSSGSCVNFQCTFVTGPQCSGLQCGPDPICGLSCGTCTPPNTCGGGGTAGQCGCTPNCSCASSTCTGSTCSNGCGGTCAGTESCPTCNSSTCSGSVCQDYSGGICVYENHYCGTPNTASGSGCTYVGCDSTGCCQANSCITEAASSCPCAPTCTPDCSCASCTYTGSSCTDPVCGTSCPGTENPSTSCNGITCGQTNACGQTCYCGGGCTPAATCVGAQCGSDSCGNACPPGCVNGEGCYSYWPTTPAPPGPGFCACPPNTCSPVGSDPSPGCYPEDPNGQCCGSSANFTCGYCGTAGEDCCGNCIGTGGSWCGGIGPQCIANGESPCPNAGGSCIP